MYKWILPILWGASLYLDIISNGSMYMTCIDFGVLVIATLWAVNKASDMVLSMTLCLATLSIGSFWLAEGTEFYLCVPQYIFSAIFFWFFLRDMNKQNTENK